MNTGEATDRCYVGLSYSSCCCRSAPRRHGRPSPSMNRHLGNSQKDRRPEWLKWSTAIPSCWTTEKEVRLVGIQAPKLPLNRPNFKEWPLAQEAKAELEKLVLNQRVTLSYGGERTDRHGRTLAHLHTDDGTWAQGE